MSLSGWKKSGFKPVVAALVMSSILGFSMRSNVAVASEYHTTFIGNTAVGGFDPVAYFTLGVAVKGEHQYSWEWKEASWRFSSQEHLDMFKANPEKYAPKYGGYCAYAVSDKGRLYRGSPQHWKIIDGNLYLNHNTSINKRWLEDVDAHIRQADIRWQELQTKK